MSDEDTKILTRQVSDIHAFVFGVENQGGLARDVETIRQDVAKLKSWKTKIIGGAVAASLLGTKGLDWLTGGTK